MNNTQSLKLLAVFLFFVSVNSNAYTVTYAGGAASTPTEDITTQATEDVLGDQLAINQDKDSSPVFADGDTIEISLSGGATFADTSVVLEVDVGGAGTGDLATASLITPSPQGKSTLTFSLTEGAPCGGGFPQPICLASTAGFILSGSNVAGQATNFNLPQVNGRDIYITFTVRDSGNSLKGTVQHLLFDNTLPGGATEEESQAVVRNVLSANIRNITAQGAGLSGLLTGQGFTGDNINFIGEFTPLTSLVSTEEFALPFALSLGDGKGSFAYTMHPIERQNANQSHQHQSIKSKYSKASQQMANPYNVWVKGRWTGITDTRGGTEGDGDFGLVMAGADYRYTKDTLLGVLLQLDFYDQTTTGQSAKGKGHGWMLGPYMVMRLDDNLVWDGRFSLGQSDNKINISDSGWDKYDGERWQLETNFTGQFEYRGWDILPQIGLQYFEEEQKAFTTSNGVYVAAQTVAVGNLTFGPELSKNWHEENDVNVRTFAGLKGIWDFKAPDIDHTSGASISTEKLRARAEFGVDIAFAEGRSVYAKFAYDGIGVSGYSAQSFEVASNMPANFGFLPLGSQLKSSFSHSISDVDASQMMLNLIVPLH